VTLKEPPIDNNPSHLWLPFYQRIQTLFDALTKRGFDPMIFEGYRSQERQDWLYGYGRTHHKKSKPKTWTKESKHSKTTDGGKPCAKAADVVSKSKLWASSAFYTALREEVAKISGIGTLYPQEACHVQWNG
jgi:hypothetical protein